MQLNYFLTFATVNFPCHGFEMRSKQVSKSLKGACEGDRDSVFGNRLCKNTLERETDLVLLIGIVVSL